MQPNPAKLVFSRLRGALQRNEIEVVADHELEEAISILYKHVKDAGFFAEGFTDMKRVVDDETGLEVQLAPHRKFLPRDSRANTVNECVLCRPHDHRSRRIQWRNLYFLPNKYPYLPAEYKHVLILTKEHRPQVFDSKVLRDLIDYQQCAGGTRPVTLHFNGNAGNSQVHLHWQATHETLPIQKLLDSDQLKLTTLYSSNQGSLASYDKGIYRGFLIEGDERFVCESADVIVQCIYREPRTTMQGEDGKISATYNMVLLQSKGALCRLLIQPRRASHLRVKFGTVGRVGVGAFTLGGIFLMSKPEVPEGFFQQVTEHVRRTTVGVSEFDWIEELISTMKAKDSR
ncbi:MAG: hypothetical protein VYC39_12735 [Myxococcota bacterium]|nr:hypothetical protein [Myxococcota bacterium]